MRKEKCYICFKRKKNWEEKQIQVEKIGGEYVFPNVEKLGKWEREKIEKKIDAGSAKFLFFSKVRILDFFFPILLSTCQ